MTLVDGGTVVVTGAAGGIGSAVVTWLREQGATVIGADVDPCDADVVVEVDLTATDAVEVIADAVGDIPLAGLVNNAAVSTRTSGRGLAADEFDRIVAVNLRAPFLLSERLLPLLHAGGGSVVHVASVHALATSVGGGAYAASKGGLVALTRAQAVDWRAHGYQVRVNAVAPGAIDTPMLRDGLERTGLTMDQLGGRHPVGRVGRPEEIAATIGYLLSEAAGFMTGAVLVADGGATAQLSTEV